MACCQPEPVYRETCPLSKGEMVFLACAWLRTDQECLNLNSFISVLAGYIDSHHCSSGRRQLCNSRGALRISLFPEMRGLNCWSFSQEMLIQDFRELRRKVKEMGLLKPNVFFFFLIFLHCFLMDIGSWVVIWYFGKSWVPFLIGVAMFTIAQVNEPLSLDVRDS